VFVGVSVGVLVGVSVGVFVGVSVGVFVGVLVGVSVGVFVGVSVGVLVGVLVGVSVGVLVGVFVGVSVGVLVGVSVGVLVGFVGVLVGVSVGVFVGVFVGVSVGVLVGVSVGVLVGVSVCVFVGVLVGVFVGVFVSVCVGVGVGLSCRMTQSEGSEFGSRDGYEHTSSSVAEDAPTSASTMLHEASRSFGNSSPVGNGSVGWVLVEQLDEKDGIEVIGLVQRSFLASPQVYKVIEMGSSVGSVTHNEKFTFPSPSVSNSAQASSVLWPLTVISSQFQITVRDVGRPALSTQSRVRSFCPGSSLAPAVSLTHWRTASAGENEMMATPSAKSDASNRTRRNRERDLVNTPNDLLTRSRNDENIGDSFLH
jgi:hypothetical protein